VPAIKLATNNALFERMRDDMDVNCGDLLTGTAMPETGSSHNPAICPSANRP
jgi:altronate dehydratase